MCTLLPGAEVEEGPAGVVPVAIEQLRTHSLASHPDTSRESSLVHGTARGLPIRSARPCPNAGCADRHVVMSLFLLSVQATSDVQTLQAPDRLALACSNPPASSLDT